MCLGVSLRPCLPLSTLTPHHSTFLVWTPVLPRPASPLISPSVLRSPVCVSAPLRGVSLGEFRSALRFSLLTCFGSWGRPGGAEPSRVGGRTSDVILVPRAAINVIPTTDPGPNHQNLWDGSRFFYPSQNNWLAGAEPSEAATATVRNPGAEGNSPTNGGWYGVLWHYYNTLWYVLVYENFIYDIRPN